MTDVDRLSQDLARVDPELFARVAGRGDADECERVIENLPADRKAAIVARLPAVRVRQLLDSGRHSPEDWLVDAPFDDAVTLLSRIPRERRLALVNNLKDKSRQRQLLRNQRFPLHSIGALIEDIPLRVSAESSAAEMVVELRKLAPEANTPAIVVDAEGHYVGVLDGWSLLLRSPETGTLREFVVALKAVRPETPSSALATSAEWGSRNWLPVVDNRRRPLGAVTRQKVLDAASLQSGRAPGRHDLLLDLLADFVSLVEDLLYRALSPKSSR